MSSNSLIITSTILHLLTSQYQGITPSPGWGLHPSPTSQPSPSFYVFNPFWSPNFSHQHVAMLKFSSFLKNEVKSLSIPSSHHPISFLLWSVRQLRTLSLFLSHRWSLRLLQSGFHFHRPRETVPAQPKLISTPLRSSLIFEPHYPEYLIQVVSCPTF